MNNAVINFRPEKNSQVQNYESAEQSVVNWSHHIYTKPSELKIGIKIQSFRKKELRAALQESGEKKWEDLRGGPIH